MKHTLWLCSLPPFQSILSFAYTSHAISGEMQIGFFLFISQVSCCVLFYPFIGSHVHVGKTPHTKKSYSIHESNCNWSLLQCSINVRLCIGNRVENEANEEEELKDVANCKCSISKIHSKNCPCKTAIKVEWNNVEWQWKGGGSFILYHVFYRPDFRRTWDQVSVWVKRIKSSAKIKEMGT